MSNQMETNDLLAKLGELYQHCAALEKAKEVLKKGVHAYLPQRYSDNLFNIGTVEDQRNGHLKSYEYNKPQPKPDDDDTSKVDVKAWITQEREQSVIRHERHFYAPWAILTLAVTVLCFAASLVIGVKEALAQNPFGAMLILIYAAASVLTFHSVIWKNPRSKFAPSAASAGAGNPIWVFVLLIAATFFLRIPLALAVAMANAVLGIVFILQPSRKGQAAARKAGKYAQLYDPSKYVPSKELQQKIAKATEPKQSKYQAELAEYERKFQAKLRAYNDEIAAMERSNAADMKIATEKFAEDEKRAKTVLAIAQQAVDAADFLNAEDKTAECVAFLYSELAEGRSQTLKSALAAYDRAKADGLAAANCDMLVQKYLNMGAANRQKAESDEAKLRDYLTQNAKLDRDIGEQTRRINNKIRENRH